MEAKNENERSILIERGSGSSLKQALLGKVEVRRKDWLSESPVTTPARSGAARGRYRGMNLFLVNRMIRANRCSYKLAVLTLGSTFLLRQSSASNRTFLIL